MYAEVETMLTVGVVTSATSTNILVVYKITSWLTDVLGNKRAWMRKKKK